MPTLGNRSSSAACASGGTYQSSSLDEDGSDEQVGLEGHGLFDVEFAPDLTDRLDRIEIDIPGQRIGRAVGTALRAEDGQRPHPVVPKGGGGVDLGDDAARRQRQRDLPPAVIAEGPRTPHRGRRRTLLPRAGRRRPDKDQPRHGRQQPPPRACPIATLAMASPRQSLCVPRSHVSQSEVLLSPASPDDRLLTPDSRLEHPCHPAPAALSSNVTFVTRNVCYSCGAVERASVMPPPPTVVIRTQRRGAIRGLRDGVRLLRGHEKLPSFRRV